LEKINTFVDNLSKVVIIDDKYFKKVNMENLNFDITKKPYLVTGKGHGLVLLTPQETLRYNMFLQTEKDKKMYVGCFSEFPLYYYGKYPKKDNEIISFSSKPGNVIDYKNEDVLKALDEKSFFAQSNNTVIFHFWSKQDEKNNTNKQYQKILQKIKENISDIMNFLNEF